MYVRAEGGQTESRANIDPVEPKSPSKPSQAPHIVVDDDDDDEAARRGKCAALLLPLQSFFSFSCLLHGFCLKPENQWE